MSKKLFTFQVNHKCRLCGVNLSRKIDLREPKTPMSFGSVMISTHECFEGMKGITDLVGFINLGVSDEEDRKRLPVSRVSPEG